MKDREFHSSTILRNFDNAFHNLILFVNNQKIDGKRLR